VSGKQHKRDLRRQRETARAEARRQERQRTIATIIVIAVVITIGGVLVFFSLNRPTPQAQEHQSPTEPAEVPAVVPAVPTATPGQVALSSITATVRSGAPFACDAIEPANASVARPTFPGGPAQLLEPGKDYRAVIQTSCGRVVVDLYEQQAPVTVNSFLFLARQNFFDGLEIFRNATTIGALQTGSGTNEATWDVGYTIRDELEAAQSEGYPAGSVAMANKGPNSNTGGSQFFFVYNDKFTLAPTYAKFGMVAEGLDVLQKIGAIPVDDETPKERIAIESVVIESSPAGGGSPSPNPQA
jgi:peptidyl-prolyl cis-trans isomerase B (cyclophilin B)